MTRTVLRGRASEAQRKLWETVKAGQALALKRIKAGVDGMTIHKAIRNSSPIAVSRPEVRNGRRVGFFHGTGHGLGLEIHEYPRLQKVVLKAGQVLTVEPGLYYPGSAARGLEDVVIVTKTGCRICRGFRSSWRSRWNAAQIRSRLGPRRNLQTSDSATPSE
jgi:Xaa-Pro aminopeptidase